MQISQCTQVIYFLYLWYLTISLFPMLNYCLRSVKHDMIMMKSANSILCIGWNCEIIEYRVTNYSQLYITNNLRKLLMINWSCLTSLKIRFQITAVMNNITAVLKRQTKGNQWAYVALTEWKIILEVNVVET